MIGSKKMAAATLLATTFLASNEIYKAVHTSPKATEEAFKLVKKHMTQMPKSQPGYGV
eukprot:CAMPEP_0174932514 /NCGR_PEP_ID=MMETSP1355-20121228/35740_1 /TAXON_ID=464990 /ORGANISM="Hemiselmis tepida, Strain CCMP443" /LENGTH=57 /DNA_ID=CAMNT_0016178929 /DNA_START=238 /DNA_END=411 /DNA_ORIENTATION=-